VPGNRDYELACVLSYKDVLAGFNIRLEPETYIIREVAGRKLWIEHGNQRDAFNTFTDFGNRYGMPSGYFITASTLAAAGRSAQRGHSPWLCDREAGASPRYARLMRSSPENASNLGLRGGEGGIRTLGANEIPSSRKDARKWRRLRSHKRLVLFDVVMNDQRPWTHSIGVWCSPSPGNCTLAGRRNAWPSRSRR